MILMTFVHIGIIVLATILVIMIVSFSYWKPWSWKRGKPHQRYKLVVDHRGFSLADGPDYPSTIGMNPTIHLSHGKELMLLISQSKPSLRRRRQNKSPSARIGVAITATNPNKLDFGISDSAMFLTNTVYSGALTFLPEGYDGTTVYYVAVPGYTTGMFGEIKID